MHYRTTGLLIISCGILFSASGETATWRANPKGAGDVPTIQAAINTAASGDTVLLAPGTYGEHISIQNKVLTLRGETGAETTILDGGFTARILTIRNSGGTVTLDRLTFQNGNAQGIDNHGGAVAAISSPLRVTDCRFLSNIAVTLGGAIHTTIFATESSSPRPLTSHGLEILDCFFEGNFSGGEGGAVFSSGMGSVFSGCVFRGNSAVNGGGVGLLGSLHTFLDCVFEKNTAERGGGVYFTGTGSLVLDRVLFSGNMAGDAGGGLYMFSGLGLTLSRSWFMDNNAFRGAGTYVFKTPIHAEQVFWYKGTATDRGGGIFFDDVPEANFTRCTWLGNNAPLGASFSLMGSPLTIQNCIVGDEDPKAAQCQTLGVLDSGCNLGGLTTGDCIGFSGRRALEACSVFPERLCTLASLTGCGPVGHANEVCPTADCSTPVFPVTWGRLKAHYR